MIALPIPSVFALLLSCFAAAPPDTLARPDTIAVGARALGRAMMLESSESFDGFVMRDTVEVKNHSYRVSTAPVPQARDRWAIVTRWSSAAGLPTSVDSVIVATHPLRPLRHTVHAETDSAEVTYDRERVAGWADPGHGQPRRTFDRRLPYRVFPDSFREKLISLLPLRAGYAAEIPAFDAWSGDSGTVRMIGVRVAALDTLSSGGNWVTCWKVTVDRRSSGGMLQTLWIAASDRRVLREESRRADGRPIWWNVAR